MNSTRQRCHTSTAAYDDAALESKGGVSQDFASGSRTRRRRRRSTVAFGDACAEGEDVNPQGLVEARTHRRRRRSIDVLDDDHAESKDGNPADFERDLERDLERGARRRRHKPTAVSDDVRLKSKEDICDSFAGERRTLRSRRRCVGPYDDDVPVESEDGVPEAAARGGGARRRSHRKSTALYDDAVVGSEEPVHEAVAGESGARHRSRRKSNALYDDADVESEDWQDGFATEIRTRRRKCRSPIVYDDSRAEDITSQRASHRKFSYQDFPSERDARAESGDVTSQRGSRRKFSYQDFPSERDAQAESGDATSQRGSRRKFSYQDFPSERDAQADTEDVTSQRDSRRKSSYQDFPSERGLRRRRHRSPASYGDARAEREESAESMERGARRCGRGDTASHHNACAESRKEKYDMVDSPEKVRHREDASRQGVTKATASPAEDTSQAWRKVDDPLDLPKPELPSGRKSGFDRNASGAAICPQAVGDLQRARLLSAQPMTGAAASRSIDGQGSGTQGCCIFVGHLPPGEAEQTVWINMFSQFGKIVAVKKFLMEGYFLAQYTNPQGADLAVRMMHSRFYQGVSVNVKRSRHDFVRL